MPYIKEERKNQILKSWENVAFEEIQTPGELNFILTVLIREYFLRSGENYQAINDVVGAIEGAKAEFQRRVVSVYEDSKIEQNGDVY